jgi:hypothetical protein
MDLWVGPTHVLPQMGRVLPRSARMAVGHLQIFSDRGAKTYDQVDHPARLPSVPLPCQNQPTMTGNREYSRDVQTTAELPVPRSRRWWQQPDKDEVGGSSPPRPTKVTAHRASQRRRDLSATGKADRASWAASGSAGLGFTRLALGALVARRLACRVRHRKVPGRKGYRHDPLRCGPPACTRALPRW